MGGPVGIVVNPSASRDVRRLTSLARTVDTHERVNVVARVLGGLAAAGVDRVSYMPEPSRVVERALEAMATVGPLPQGATAPWARAVRLPRGGATDAGGTAEAAARMAEEDVACVITLGGDGTNRAVALGWPGATLVPLAGGTNNAFSLPVEPTAAGLAAGVFANDPPAHAGHLRAAPYLQVLIHGAPATLALVDVAVVRAEWVGAHAIWDPDQLVEAVIARADPVHPGLAGLGGMLHPLDGRPGALHVRFGPGARLLAPLGPGHLQTVGVRDWRVVGVGEHVRLGPGRRTLAFDGEREFVTDPETAVEVRLATDGVRVLDAAGLLREVAAAGRFVTATVAEGGGA